MTSGAVLVTLGRLPKGLEIARALARAGRRVIVADPFDLHLSRFSRSVARSVRTPAPAEDPAGYRAALETVIAEETVDLVVPVAEEALYVAAFAEGGASARFFGPDQPTMLALHDKARFIEIARGHDLRAPETHSLGSEGARRLAAAGPAILKPVHGCSGLGVRRLEAGAALDEEDEDGALGPCVVQAFVEGRARSSCAIAHGGRVIATAVYEPTALSGSVAVAFQRVEAPAIVAWSERFIAAERLSGFISFDFIEDAAGVPWAIECNPRSTSGVHFFEPVGLAAAMLRPAETGSVGFRPRRRLQQVFPCLTETQGAIFSPKRFRANARALFGSADVVWDRRDPAPLMMMTYASWPILRQCLFQGRSFGEAATADLAWRG